MLKRRPRCAGFATTSELLLITTVLVIGLVAGWVTVRNSVNAELEDLAEAAGDVNQSHASAGVLNDNNTASSSGSLFTDAPDEFAADSDDGNNDGDVATEMTLSPP
jgi:hypothetical protein